MTKSVREENTENDEVKKTVRLRAEKMRKEWVEKGLALGS